MLGHAVNVMLHPSHAYPLNIKEARRLRITSLGASLGRNCEELTYSRFSTAVVLQHPRLPYVSTDIVHPMRVHSGG